MTDSLLQEVHAAHHAKACCALRPQVFSHSHVTPLPEQVSFTALPVQVLVMLSFHSLTSLSHPCRKVAI